MAYRERQYPLGFWKTHCLECEKELPLGRKLGYCSDTCEATAKTFVEQKDMEQIESGFLKVMRKIDNDKLANALAGRVADDEQSNEEEGD